MRYLKTWWVTFSDTVSDLLSPILFPNYRVSFSSDPLSLDWGVIVFNWNPRLRGVEASNNFCFSFLFVSCGGVK